MTANDFCVWLKTVVRQNGGTLPEPLVPTMISNLTNVELALAPVRVVECHYPDRLEDGVNF
jgi:hypothetical protein